MAVFELGYTPHNLKTLLNKSGLKQKTVYQYLGKSRPAFERYLLSVEHEDHVSMNHRNWLKIIELVNEKDTKNNVGNN